MPPMLIRQCASGCAMNSSPGCTVQVRPKVSPDPCSAFPFPIFEFEALANIALDLCSDHSNDPDAAQKAVAERLQRKVSGPTIFDLVDGVPMETHGEDIMMHGRTVLTDPEACVRPAVSVTLYAESGYVVDPDDHDDFIDGDFRFIAVVPDPAD